MTIAICILLSDGIILAADSRQTVVDANGNLRVRSDTAEKIVRLTPRLAAIALGRSVFFSGEDSTPRGIRTVLKQAAAGLSPEFRLADAASVLLRHVVSASDNPTTGSSNIGSPSFYLAGYGAESELGELYLCTAGVEPSLLRTTADPGASWAGQHEIIDRIIYGYDPRLAQIVPRHSEGSPTSPPIHEFRNQLELNIDFQTMTILDALNFASDLASITSSVLRHSDGIVAKPGQPPTCGGPIDLAAVLPDEGFKWIRRKAPCAIWPPLSIGASLPVDQLSAQAHPLSDGFAPMESVPVLSDEEGGGLRPNPRM